MTSADADVIERPISHTSPANPDRSRGQTHGVRTVVVGMLVAAVIAVLSLAAFGAVRGVENRVFDGLPDSPVASAAVDVVVHEQLTRGRTCRTEPALTDHVVFQYASTGSAEIDSTESSNVAVLALDEAVAATRAGAGSIQGYCF